MELIGKVQKCSADFMEKFQKVIPGMTWMIFFNGLLFGCLGILLVTWGNPTNTGICVSCFLENIAGACGLHNNVRMMYLRPEIIGFILGAFVIALATRNFVVRGGSSPMIRFVLGFLMIVGSAMFMGCPIKLLFRFVCGDLTAIPGVFGMLVGVWIGIMFMRRGFFLGDDYEQPVSNGLVLPIITVVLLVFLLVKPAFILFSVRGSAAVHTPIWIALIVGLVLGGLSQRSRFCVVGSVRNFFLAGDMSLMTGLLLMLLAGFVTALLTGQFHPELGWEAQPGSHTAHFWSFLGMVLTGIASVFVGGCPFRQLIIAGQGDVDCTVTTFGMVAAAAMVHNWNLASTTAGPTFNGKIAVMVGLIICFMLGLFCRD